MGKSKHNNNAPHQEHNHERIEHERQTPQNLDHNEKLMQETAYQTKTRKHEKETKMTWHNEKAWRKKGRTHQEPHTQLKKRDPSTPKRYLSS